MERKTFLLKLLPGHTAEEIKGTFPRLEKAVTEHGGNDFSLWKAENMIFGYFEREDAPFPDPAGEALRTILEGELAGVVTVVSLLNMRLMYSAINRPLTDKSLVKAHRVFMTRVKPGCMEEYRRRHAGLEEAAARAIAEGKISANDLPSSNFTIWNGGDFICGYNEMEALPNASDENSGGDAAWELSMLKIMEWLTDDADRFSGEKHEKIERLV